MVDPPLTYAAVHPWWLSNGWFVIVADPREGGRDHCAVGAHRRRGETRLLLLSPHSLFLDQTWGSP